MKDYYGNELNIDDHVMVYSHSNLAFGNYGKVVKIYDNPYYKPQALVRMKKFNLRSKRFELKNVTVYSTHKLFKCEQLNPDALDIDLRDNNRLVNQVLVGALELES